MAKITPVPQGKQYETGYPFVLGPKDVFDKYINRPWDYVMEAAEAGTDGLTVTRADNPRAPEGHFAIREMRGRAFGTVGIASLVEQRW